MSENEFTMRRSVSKRNPLAVVRRISLTLDAQGIAHFNTLYTQLKRLYAFDGKPSMSLLLLVALSDLVKELDGDPKRLQEFCEEVKVASATRWQRKLRGELSHATQDTV